jgi:peptidoglycan-associated lipoprotein
MKICEKRPIGICRSGKNTSVPISVLVRILSRIGGYLSMKKGFVSSFLFALLFATLSAHAARASSDDAFWVSFWGQPRVILYGPEEEMFYQSLKEVMFARNEYNRCLNPNALDDNARWLREHPNVRFYIDGYASSRGEMIYNLMLSKRRADWVKQSLISRGVPEGRIILSVGWGELYPTCLEDSDECRTRNKVVRFTYAPNI